MVRPPDINSIVKKNAQNDSTTMTTSPTKQSWLEQHSTFIKKEITELRHFFTKPIRRFSSKSTFYDRWKRTILIAGKTKLFST
jgi:hypothetical protein